MDIEEMKAMGRTKIKRGDNFEKWREMVPENVDPRIRLCLLVVEEMDEDAVVTWDHLFDLCAEIEMDCGGVEEAIQMVLDRRSRGEKVLELVEEVSDDD